VARKAFSLTATVLLLSACAMEQRGRVLRFFFDGVPPPPGQVDTNLFESAETGNALAESKGSASKPVPILRLHDPFEERDCEACHQTKFSRKLIGGQLDVCFSCHDDFVTEMKVKHSPVEDGDCTECHNPHKSYNEHLLLQPGAALCYECHDDFADGAEVVHYPVEEGDCADCHDPHASENRHLLLQPGAALCYECHDDFADGAAVVHYPVEEGDCADCHDPHASENRHLLLQPGAALCYECHDEGDVLKIEVHQETGESACTTCHNPHAGSDALLKSHWENRMNSEEE
jgi:predicted CXXCH cytochrome family protein